MNDLQKGHPEGHEGNEKSSYEEGATLLKATSSI